MKKYYFVNGVDVCDIDGENVAVVHGCASRRQWPEGITGEALEKMLHRQLDAGEIDDFVIPSVYPGRVVMHRLGVD